MLPTSQGVDGAEVWPVALPDGTGEPLLADCVDVGERVALEVPLVVGFGVEVVLVGLAVGVADLVGGGVLCTVGAVAGPGTTVSCGGRTKMYNVRTATKKMLRPNVDGRRPSALTARRSGSRCPGRARR